MSVPLKILAVVGTIGLVSVGVIAAQNISSTKSDPTFESLANENNADYEGKYASSFKHHFMNATKKEKEAWWKESYEKLKEEMKKENHGISSAFQKANKGYGTEATALNQICLEAYTSDKSSLEADRRRDVWNYCSVERKQPVLTSQSGATTGSAKAQYGNILIDTASEENKSFWNTQNKAFKEAAGVYGGNLKSGNYFHSAYASKEIKEICETTYKFTDSSVEAEREEIIKFCSIQG